VSQLVHLQYAADDVRGYLEQAAAIVVELELDDDLKVPAFQKAVELLAGSHMTVEPNPIGMLNRANLQSR
jgi:hypothetical protein